MSDAYLEIFEHSAQPAALNMAIDEVLARLVAEGSRMESFFRWYEWAPYALSFGYFQRPERWVDIEAAKKRNLHLVRRMTGGKMVFHAKEKTFSMGFSVAEIRSLSADSTFMGQFRFLMQSFVDTLKAEGLPARFASGREIVTKRTGRLHCYAAAAGHSIYLGDQKLIGAAGAIRGGSIIIHGSIPLFPIEFPRNLLHDGENYEAPRMAHLGAFIEEALFSKIFLEVVQNLSNRIGKKVVHRKMNARDMAMCQILQLEKYANLNWVDDKKRSWEESIVNAVPCREE